MRRYFFKIVLKRFYWQIYNYCGYCQWGVAPKTCYFLFLDKKKVTKEKSRLQIILGLLFFSLPTQYNSSSFVLLKQYCLLNASAASLKTVAISQNSLRPFEI
jgi:hypothetical protein